MGRSAATVWSHVGTTLLLVSLTLAAVAPRAVVSSAPSSESLLSRLDRRYGVQYGAVSAATSTTPQRVRLVTPAVSTGLSTSSLVGLPSFNFAHNDQHVDRNEWIITVKGPITDVLRSSLQQQLSSIGAKLGSYMPHDSFMVTGAAHDNDAFVTSLSSIPSVTYIQPLAAVSKVSRQLTTLIVHQHTLTTQSVNDASPAASADEMHRLRVHVAHEQATNEMVTQWSESMVADGMSRTELSLINERYVDASVATNELPRVVSWFASRYDVHFVEQKQTFEIQNKFASVVVQDNNKNGSSGSLWQHDLNGQGQVVSVGDTGIDYDSCFFHDPSYAVPIDSVRMEHRKIVMYMALGDAADSANGHGTHVAGSIAGEVLTTKPAAREALTPYNGVAYKSKLAFFDFKRESGNELLVPDDLYNNYFGFAQSKTGAAISSNSWGSPDGAYSSYCADTDRYVNEHQSFLPIFAAGNYGERGIFSMSAPGVSKNALTVGASLNSGASFYALGQSVGFAVVSPSLSAGTYQVVPAAFGKPYHTISIPSGTPLVIADPFHACTALTNSASMNGAVVLVVRGGGDTCTFTSKADRLQAAGAKLMLVVNNIAGPAIIMGGGGLYTLSAGMITQHDWNFINASATQASSPISVQAPVGFDAPDLNEANLASFSSRGPTYDGRIKPDIVAPGMMVVSSRSDGKIQSLQCDVTDLLPMQGTSMATPVTAGAVTLVRQYYMDGFYPTGARVTTDAFVPSAALMKATVIASGRNIGGEVNTIQGTGVTREDVEAAPSKYQGFGRIQLDKSLAFADTMECDRPSLYVVESQPIRTNEVRSYCFQARPVMNHPYPLRATLVWSDPAGKVNSAFQLMNNLDLFIVNNDTQQLVFGNNHYFHDVDGDHWPADDTNNVEQVTVNSTHVTRDTLFSVHVRGTSVATAGGQNYSLVVNGFFKQLPLESCSGLIVCPNRCSGKGTCNSETGRCTCPGDRAGDDCSQIVVSLERSSHAGEVVRTPVPRAVPVGSWEYFQFTVEKWMLNDSKGISVTMSRTSGNGDPDLYLTVGTAPVYPSFAVWDYQAIGCDSCEKPTPSIVYIPYASLQPGTIVRMGVYGYCCQSSSVDVIVTSAVPPPVPVVDEPTPTGVVAVIALVVTISLASLGFGIVWWRRRRTSNANAGQGYALPGVNGPAGFVPLSENRAI